MQPSVTLSQKDIERFKKVVTRLRDLAEAFAGKTGVQAPIKRRRRRRRKATIELKAPSVNGRRKRHAVPEPEPVSTE